MRMLGTIVWPLCGLFIALSSQALGAEQRPQMVVGFLEDAGGNKSLAEVISDGEFTPSPGHSFNFGFSASAYWFKIEVSAPSAPDKYFLRLDTPLLDYISFYTPKGDDYTQKNAGDKLDFAHRDLSHRAFHFRLKKTSATYYLRIESSNSIVFPMAIVDYEEILNELNLHNIIVGIFYGSFIIMLLYNLFMYVAIRSAQYVFFAVYLAGFAFVFAAMQGHTFEFLHPSYPAANDWIDAGVIVAIAGGVIFTQLHLNTKKLYPVLHIIYKYTLLYLGAVFVIRLFLPYAITIRLVMLAVFVVLIGLTVNCALGVIRKDRTTKIYAIAWGAMILGVMITALLRFGLYDPTVLTRYAAYFGGMLQAALISLSLADQINTLKNNLAELNLKLEDRVRERTAELQQTLVQVNSLKEQQDADYFLTSLLIRPLTGVEVRSPNVKVDIYQQQKKKFSFKGKKYELGGDICIAHEIELNGRSFTVFINADAMGKSMQGAGGVLVLGSVFHSIIERTLLIPAEKKRAPERWLKNTFLELHKVFETFNGSMLISLVIGLVDNSSGLVYSINAEHPWSVLYRDGRASFIENDLDFRKLGTEGMLGRIFIRTFQLQPGDIFITGSDGRDDIELQAEGPESSRIVNEDEEQFLRRVEECNADLTKIAEALVNFGSLIDDLSLLSIHFVADRPQPLPADTVEPLARAEKLLQAKQPSQALKELETVAGYAGQDYDLTAYWTLAGKAYMLTKKFKEGAECFDNIIQDNPADSDSLYLAAYCHKQNRNYQRAAELGERLLMRNPAILKNVINLADTHLQLGNLERARKLIDLTAQFESQNKYLEKLKEKLARKSDKSASSS